MSITLIPFIANRKPLLRDAKPVGKCMVACDGGAFLAIRCIVMLPPGHPLRPGDILIPNDDIPGTYILEGGNAYGR